MRRPKYSFSTLPLPQKTPLGPPKGTNDQQIKLESKVRIEGTIENESCSTTRVDPKIVFKPNLHPKYSLLGPQKAKKYPKIKSKIKS